MNKDIVIVLVEGDRERGEGRIMVYRITYINKDEVDRRPRALLRVCSFEQAAQITDEMEVEMTDETTEDMNMRLQRKLENLALTGHTQNLSEVLREIENSLSKESRLALKEAGNIPRPVCGRICEEQKTNTGLEKNY